MSKVDAKEVNANAKFGVLLTSEEAMEDVAAWVKANGLADEVATWSPGKRDNQLMISSVDEWNTLNGLIRYAENLEGAEVIRRLTLEDLAESLESLGAYDYVSVETAKDAKKREFPILVCKISGGGLTIRQILDHGIRKNARVLAITLTDVSGEWAVDSYAITQYETNPDGIEAGEEESFLVADYDQPEDEADERSKFDRCRDAVIDYRITGGRGSQEWIASRVEAATKAGMDAKSAEVKAVDDLNDAYGKFSPVLHAMSRMAVETADTIYPTQEVSERRNNRGRYQDKPLGQSLADKFAALIGPTE